MPFAWAIVDMYDDLTRTARGQKELPAQVPPAMDSVKAMRGNPNVISGLEWARLDEVYTYLRLGKYPEIPPEWKELLPKTPPLEG